MLTTTAIVDGSWLDPSVWDNGVPTLAQDVVVPAGRVVQLDGAEHLAKTLMIHGTVEVIENTVLNKSLVSNWILIHDSGILRVGSAIDRFDTNKLTITLEGDNPSQNVPGHGVTGNDAFLMTDDGGSLELFGKSVTSWTQLGATAAVGSSGITLKEPVDWSVGDEIVIATSSTDMNQAETRTITAINSNRTFLSLNAPLTYRHYGNLQSYYNGVDTHYTLDERAEVGLLTRTIKIQGDADSVADGIGGNLMFMAGTDHVNIDSVEFYHMGQKARLGRYPIHWHLAGDRQGDFIKNSSIHRSFNRALTIHAAHNILVERNVAYDHVGHGFFLENAVETGNKFYYNLGLVTREPKPGEELLPSDLGPKQFQISGPGTYWITNPNNEFVGNVAAGSQNGSGFWFALPSGPLNESMNDFRYLFVNPSTTALGVFIDNVAHANFVGLDVDGGPDRNTGVPVITNYSPPTIADFRGFTAYANAGNGVYFRGTDKLHLTDARLGDNYLNVMFAGAQTISDSLMVGDSANPNTAQFPFLRKGYAIYDGPAVVRNVHFAGFNDPDARLFDVIGAASRFTNHWFENVTIDAPSTPVRFAGTIDNRTLSRHWGFSLLDVDGSLTGSVGKSVIFDHPMMRSDGDVRPPGWENAVLSQRSFGLLALEHGLGVGLNPTVTFRRVDGPGASASHVDVPSVDAHNQIGVILNTDFVYEIDYHSAPSTNRIDFVVSSVVGGGFVFLRLNNPWEWASITSASRLVSEQEVRNSAGSAYYIDLNGDVFLKIVIAPTAGSKMVSLQQAQAPAFDPDFNNDGYVDAADYVLWRRTLGQTGLAPFSGADGNGDRAVTHDDYLVWRSRFGQTMATGNGATSTAVASTEPPQDLTAQVARQAPITTIWADLAPRAVLAAAEPVAPLREQAALIEPKGFASQTLTELAPHVASPIDSMANSSPRGLHPENQQPDSRERADIPFAASPDDALVAWLASRRQEPRSETLAADAGATASRPDFRALPEQLTDSLDMAFALWTKSTGWGLWNAESPRRAAE